MNPISCLQKVCVLLFDAFPCCFIKFSVVLNISGFVHDYDAIVAHCQKSAGLSIMKTVSLLAFTSSVVMIGSSHIATTAYIRYYDLQEPAEYQCLSIKSITIAVVSQVAGYSTLHMTITSMSVDGAFPVAILIGVNIPIILLVLYVVKEKSFTYPLITKHVKILFCNMESEVRPDLELEENSAGGIYIGPRSRVHPHVPLDDSTGGIYIGPHVPLDDST